MNFLEEQLEKVSNFEEVLSVLKQLGDRDIMNFFENDFFLNKYKINSSKSLQILTL